MELAGCSCVVLVQVFWLCMEGLVLASNALSGLLIPLLLSLLEDCRTQDGGRSCDYVILQHHIYIYICSKLEKDKIVNEYFSVTSESRSDSSRQGPLPDLLA